MRTDYVNTLNASLEAQADHLEQVSAFYLHESERTKSIAKNLRALASTEAQPNDPRIDVRLPLNSRNRVESTRPNSAGQQAIAGGTIQNGHQTDAA